VAQPFDPRTGVLQGEAERLAEDVLVDGSVRRAQFDTSGGGVLADASGGLMPWQVSTKQDHSRVVGYSEVLSG
jgi:hypothetical protein